MSVHAFLEDSKELKGESHTSRSADAFLEDAKELKSLLPFVRHRPRVSHEVRHLAYEQEKAGDTLRYSETYGVYTRSAIEPSKEPPDPSGMLYRRIRHYIRSSHERRLDAEVLESLFQRVKRIRVRFILEALRQDLRAEQGRLAKQEKQRKKGNQKMETNKIRSNGNLPMEP